MCSLQKSKNTDMLRSVTVLLIHPVRTMRNCLQLEDKLFGNDGKSGTNASNIFWETYLLPLCKVKQMVEFLKLL